MEKGIKLLSKKCNSLISCTDRFNIFDCWPSELSGPDLDAGSNDIAIEKVVLAVERIERDS